MACLPPMRLGKLIMKFTGADAPSGRKRILLVEDEQFVALALEGMLSDLGFEVMGTVAEVSAALALIAREEIGGVILDVKLGRERCDPVADLLAERACPFFFVTGCDVSELPVRHAGCTVLQKPFGLEQLLPALRENFGFQISGHSGFGMQSQPAENPSLMPSGPPSVPQEPFEPRPAIRAGACETPESNLSSRAARCSTSIPAELSRLP